MALHRLSAAAAPLRYGLIGPGSHAEEQLLPVLAQLPGARLEAVAASRLESATRAAERWQARYATDTWTDLVDPSVVDALVVSASPELHAEVVGAALAAGLSVFVEKPPAPDTAALRRLIAAELAAAPGTVAFVGFNFPYGQSYRKLRGALTAHGELRAMDVRMVSAKPLAPAWQCETVLESLLQGLGTHAVDLVLRELGAPERVSAHQALIDERRRAVRITLEYADGRLATVHLGNHSNRLEYRCELVTDQGVTGVLEQHNTLVLGRPAGAAGTGLLDAKETLRYDWPSRRGGYDRTGYGPELASFHESVTGRRPSTSPLANCLDTYLVLDEVLDQLTGSVR
ncbi:Gfo/Idh/MocA family oxidoreductase [Kitasatospora sp. HPMI-4]|uniref:Gfo/Idh/MocA family oxidoreductase n=1 Tax=Kitasatospora sp. HPMI-4 TaxID=3448443 RepID=UPI003F1D2363